MFKTIHFLKAYEIVGIIDNFQVHNLNNPLGQPMYERAGVLESPRAARVLFACDDRMIVVVGLTKGSNRQVIIKDS